MAVIWMACDRQRRVHAVPADVHSSAYHEHGLIDAVCGITVYPSLPWPELAECSAGTIHVLFGIERRDGEWTVVLLRPLPTPRSGE
jgi:hypothetical protein